jgi:hypothetical protein
MADCLTCAEIEQKICDLADEISSASCGGLVVREGDTQFDHSPEIRAKIEVLRTYRELHAVKCKGANELYQFVHVPCVRPYTCVGSSCGPQSLPRHDRRRYRR